MKPESWLHVEARSPHGSNPQLHSSLESKGRGFMHGCILEHPQPRNFPRICVFIQSFFTVKKFFHRLRAQTKMAANSYNFTGSGKDFKQLFYILTTEPKSTSLQWHWCSYTYSFRVLLLNPKSTASLSAISLIYKTGKFDMFQRRFSSKNLCYTERNAVRDIRNGHNWIYGRGFGDDV